MSGRVSTKSTEQRHLRQRKWDTAVSQIYGCLNTSLSSQPKHNLSHSLSVLEPFIHDLKSVPPAENPSFYFYDTRLL